MKATGNAMPRFQAFANNPAGCAQELTLTIFPSTIPPLIRIIQQSHNLQPLKGVAAHGEEAVQFLYGKQPTTEVFITAAFPLDLQSTFISGSHEREFCC